MVDIVGINNGMRPEKNAMPVSYFDLSTSAGQFQNKLNNIRDPAPRVYQEVKKRPSEFNDILSCDTLRGVLHGKSFRDAITQGRPEESLTDHMYPKVGYARFQGKGLAIDHNKPMDGSIMPIAGFYNPDAPNVLGNLAGK